MEVQKENKIKAKYSSAVGTLGQYYAKSIKPQQKAAYALGQREVLLELGDFIWKQTDGNPSNISVPDILVYLQNKLHELENPNPNNPSLQMNIQNQQEAQKAPNHQINNQEMQIQTGDTRIVVENEGPNQSIGSQEPTEQANLYYNNSNSNNTGKFY